jgi:hypothetical protein
LFAGNVCCVAITKKGVALGLFFFFFFLFSEFFLVGVDARVGFVRARFGIDARSSLGKVLGNADTVSIAETADALAISGRESGIAVNILHARLAFGVYVRWLARQHAFVFAVIYAPVWEKGR